MPMGFYVHGASTKFHLSPQMDFAATAYDLVANAVQEGIKTLCAAVPGIEIAPLGAGVETEPDDICDQVVDFVRTLVDLPVGFSFAAHDFAMEEEGFNACNPYQVGFSRLFCNSDILQAIWTRIAVSACAGHGKY